MGGIYAIQGDGQLIEMVETAYVSEALLQGFLADHPSLLAGDQMDTRQPRRWVLVKREAELPSEEEGAARWSVDHLFLDQDAIPTIVEVKRSSDTRIRREVVGQMLDYAANAVVYWPVEKVRAMFEAQHGEAADQALGALTNTPDDMDTEQFWQKVKTNLQAGRVRLVFVADYIPPELRRIVEFLNQQMDPAEVLAVEIRQYVGQGLRTLVPRVIGQTALAELRKVTGSSEAARWDQARFMRVLAEKRGASSAEVAERILKWAERKGLRLWWGQGTKSGSFYPLLDQHGKSYWTVAVWTYGSVEMQFQIMKTMAPLDDEAKRRQLLEMLNAIPGVNLPEDSIARRPSIPLTTFMEGAVYEQFEKALDWILDQYAEYEPFVAGV